MESTTNTSAYMDAFNASAATFAADIDNAFFINLWVSIVLGLSVLAPMVYFAWKYRESNVKDEEIENITHHTGLEITWTVIPTAMLMVMFWYGYDTMKTLRTMPDANNAITVQVEGSKWKWRYEYAPNSDGFIHKLGGAYTKSTDETKAGTMGISALYVPVDTNIILEMTAPLDDVLHAFYVPAFRMKEDVVPGRTTKQWFKATELGEYDVECAEYCGTDHSYMYSKIVVLPKAEYEAWFNGVDDTPKGNYDQSGASLLQQHGCKTCHATLDDAIFFGPTLKTRSLTKEQVLNVINNGQDTLGYAMGAMPAATATGADATEIAAYVSGGMKGSQPASFTSACAGCHGEDGKGQYGTAPSLVDYDVDLLRNVLKNGKKGDMGNMPAFPYITDEEVSAIAEHLKSL